MCTNKIQAEKAMIRHRLLQIRREESVYHLDTLIVENIVRFLNDKIHTLINIGIYYPIKGEVDILSYFIENNFNNQQKNEHIILSKITPKININIDYNLLLPKITSDNIMNFVPYDPQAPLLKNKFNILEPISNKAIIPDIILAPGVAFSEQGHRLGLGKGYYDRYKLRNPQVNIIGICYAFQMFKTLPFTKFDCKVNAIITETKTTILSML